MKSCAYRLYGKYTAAGFDNGQEVGFVGGLNINANLALQGTISKFLVVMLTIHAVDKEAYAK